MTKENLKKLEEKLRELVPRPPDLEAVLEAIKNGIKNPHEVWVDAEGTFWKVDWIGGTSYELDAWHFGKSFEEQPEELHDFLFKLFNL